MARRFTFRLQPVLEHRQRLEDEQARVLAVAAEELRRATDARDDLVAQRDRLRDEIVRDHASFDLDRLRATYAHLRWLDGEIISADERVDACWATMERQRLVLVEKSRDRQVLAKLRERTREAFRAEAARADQRELDDLNARAHERAHPSQGAPT